MAATRDGAEIAKFNTGLVAAGRNADFIVLDANPLENISNTRKIDKVYPARRGGPARRDGGEMAVAIPHRGCALAPQSQSWCAFSRQSEKPEEKPSPPVGLGAERDGARRVRGQAEELFVKSGMTAAK